MAVKTITTKTINVTKSIEIDGMQVESVNATINTSDPENANLTHYISNQSLYKLNRADVRAAEATAEDEIYTEQDKLIAELKGGVK